jgi:hypothetical protein
MEIIEAACVSAKTGRAETIRAVQAKNGNMPGPANFHATAAPNFLA